MYIPPADSNIFSYTDRDYWVTLAHQIARFISKGEVIVVGDMNARTGNLAQNNETNSVHVTINESVTISEQQRNSRDDKINEHGRALHELCQSSSMVILNGHHAGDNPGSFTCVRPQGSSVVDYALVSPPVLDRIGFKVDTLRPVLSDHCPLIVHLPKTLPTEQSNVDDQNTSNMSNLVRGPPVIIWDNDAETKYRDAFLSADIQTSLRSLIQDLASENETSDIYVERLNNILLYTAQKSLVTICPKPSCRPRKRKTNNIVTHVDKRSLDSSPQGGFSKTTLMTQSFVGITSRLLNVLSESFVNKSVSREAK